MCWVVWLGMPAGSRAAETVDLDVTLRPDRTLSGSLFTELGGPIRRTEITLVDISTQQAVTAVTSETGAFSVALNRGGVYDCTVDRETVRLRVWQHGAAPPQAVPRVLLVLGDPVRGQSSFDEGEPFPSQPAGEGFCQCDPPAGKTCHLCRAKHGRWRLFRPCHCRLRCLHGCQCGCDSACHFLGYRLGFTAAAVAVIYASIDQDDAS